ncbi:hypothetical protein OG320_04220 [Microbispora sp. NBC_01189]|uniref:hypothetical protein n=1 Tax=unclassified Microbispora TaxID=2614687 RepID=UPI002E11B074|nr:hypothetical protein OG320_04220 [Microbispora sp. NBC_01189]
MSRYQVQVTDTYARGAQRPWSTVRRVLAEESGPCLTPVLLRFGRLRRWIACGRRLPHDRQCRNCCPRIVVTEVRRITA